jgi:hypothetical protein
VEVAVNPPNWLVDYEKKGVEKYEAKVTDAEESYYEAMKNYQKEFYLVEARLGKGFDNTNELHVMKYKEGIQGVD